MTSTASLLRTALHDFHVQRGAKMVDFAGWSMPLHYGSIIEEHRQVRRSGGFFDVSHMGRLRFTGRDACRFLDRACTRQVLGMEDGQVRYGLVCNDRGGCRDDVLIYRESDHDYRMVCNASNRLKLLDHFASIRGDLVFDLKDETESTVMVALQGPCVMNEVSGLSSEIPGLRRYRFMTKNVLFATILVSRTGYTGEDGVEAILPAGLAARGLKMAIGTLGDDGPIQPAGLGARDSLRLEAGMPLYGHEIDEDTDPLSAGLSFAVTLDKGRDGNDAEPFIGQDALLAIAESEPTRRLVGLHLRGPRSARQGMEVYAGDEAIGVVTSGCMSPTLDRSIAMAYVRGDLSDETLCVDLGRQRIEARITELPFYAR